MAEIQGQNQLLDFLRALKRRRRQVLVPAVLFVSLVLFAVIVPKKYRLTMRMEIASDASQSDARAKSTQELAVRREAPAVSDHTRNYSRVKDVIDRNLRLWPEYANCAIDEETGTIFVDISYGAEDKDRAAKFQDDLTKSWLEDVAESDRESLMQQRGF